MSSDLRIAISGKSGCGNTTVSRLLASRLGLRLINYTFKDLARERGMSFDELRAKAETDSQYDLTIDREQVRQAMLGGCVLGSRLAIWLLRDTAFTVYLSASPETRAGRIARREGLPLEQTLAATEERDQHDRERYIRLYGFDIDQYRFAALVVDTERLEPAEVAARILERVDLSTL
jgi:CMP/dCMP kinase